MSIRYLMILVFFLFAEFNYATMVNGRILTYALNDSVVEAHIQLNTNTGSDDLGGATIVLKYDTTKFHYVNRTDSNYNYVFHNFSGGNYASAFVTQPFQNELWINIELEVSNNGIIVSGMDDWTDLLTIKLNSLSVNNYDGIYFETVSPYWAIYDGDNCTLWELGNFEVLSSINDLQQADFNYALEQNYPNPFNPTTKIRFSLKSEEHVKLNVYNVVGELVRELINDRIAAGIHEIKFNAINLPSGVYIYKFETKNFIASKKMLLLR